MTKQFTMGPIPDAEKLEKALSMNSSFGGQSELAKKMNDILVQKHYMIPLIWRGSVSAHSNKLKGVRMNAWDSELWNVADWHKTN